MRELTRPLHDEAQGSFHNDTDVDADVERRELAAATCLTPLDLPSNATTTDVEQRELAATAARGLARLDLSRNATSTLSQSGSGASSRSSARNTYLDPSSEYLRGVRVEEETCLYNSTYEELSRIAGASAYVSIC